MKKSIFVILLFLQMTSFGRCTFENLTGQSVLAKRNDIFNELDNEGVRLAWLGMKQMNALYLSGTVDAVTSKFENSLCEQIESPEIKKKYPNANIEVRKMDFKGYFVTCRPKYECRGFNLEGELSKIPAPKFPITDDVPKPKSLEFVTASAKNYQEGYIRARIKAGYPSYDGKVPSLDQFIKEELDKAIKEAFGVSDVKDMEKLSKKVQVELNDNLSLYRTDKVSNMDSKYKKLALALDVLLETPYSGSNNFEEELKNCINNPGKITKGFSLCTAQSGDDMNVFVRKNGAVVKVVAVDARGLGTLNMVSRLDEYIHLTKEGGQLKGMEDIFSLANNAIAKADTQMKRSMNGYVKNLKSMLNQGKHISMDLNQILRASHDVYGKKQTKNPRLMQMRAGAIELCGSDAKCLLNRMTTIHNNLKDLEKKGIDGHFGDSCIGTEYWLRFLKVRGVLEVSP